MMQAETKYWIEVPKVTIETLATFLDDVLDLNVSIDATVGIEFGLEPGTFRITVTDVE